MDSVIKQPITVHAAQEKPGKQRFWEKAAVLAQGLRKRFARDPAKKKMGELNKLYSKYHGMHKSDLKLARYIISTYANLPFDDQAAFRKRVAKDIVDAKTNVLSLLDLSYRLGDATNWQGQYFDKEVASVLLGVVNQYHPNDLVSAVNARKAVQALWKNNYRFREFMKLLLGHDDAEIVRFAVFRISASSNNFNLLDDSIQSLIQKSHTDDYLASFVTNHFDRFLPDSRLAIFETFSRDGFPPLAFPLLLKMLDYDDLRSRTLDLLLISVKSDRIGSEASLKKELARITYNLMGRIDAANGSERPRMLGVFQKYFPLMDNNALLANEEEFLSFGLNLAKGKDFMDMFAGYDVLKRFWSAGSENARKAMEELSDHLKYMLYWAKPPAVEPADKDNALVIIGEMRRDRVID